VAKISAAQLGKAKQRLALECKLREDVNKLQNQMSSNHKNSTPMPPSNQTQYAPSPYRFGYRYGVPPAAAPQTQPAALTQPVMSLPTLPAYQHPQTPVNTQNPQTPQAPNPFASTAQVQRGNLFYGHRGYPQTPTRARGGSPADRARAAAQYATIPHHPDTETGNQAYNQQVQEWHTQHGADAIPNSQRPYPLKPGTSPIGSRECFNCGIATAPPHQAYDCANAPLPPQEMKWRETVSRLVSRSLASTTAMAAPTNVQFVAPTASPHMTTHYPSPFPVAYPQYSYYPAPYEPYEYAGNEYGPQQ
jgi:hypothetical protein